MKKIDHQFLDLNGSIDIFASYRSYYETDNPHKDGIITLYSPSTFEGNENYRTDISTLISKPDDLRWVSGGEPYFTIDFHQSYIDLLYYKIETHPNVRFITQWALYGIRGNNEYLIDERNDEPLCQTNCKEYTIKTFKCKFPGSFTKFKFILTGPDSYNTNILSMSAIQFFGVINPHLPIITCGSFIRIRFTELLITSSFFFFSK